MPKLFSRYPDASSMAAADPRDLSQMIEKLGFKNRRTRNIIEMSRHFLSPTWNHAKELPGIGDYAAAAWEIFVLRKLPETCPKDHALTKYWHWRRNGS